MTDGIKPQAFLRIVAGDRWARVMTVDGVEIGGVMSIRVREWGPDLRPTALIEVELGGLALDRAAPVAAPLPVREPTFDEVCTPPGPVWPDEAVTAVPKPKIERAEGVAPLAAVATPARPPHPNAWSEDELGVLRAGLAAAVPVSALAKKIGRPLPGTQQKIKLLRRAGVLPPGRGKAGAPVAPPVAPRAVPVAPLAAKAAPASLPVIGTVPPFDPGKPAWWRQIEAHLNALGHVSPWTPALDLALVEGLAQGTPKNLLADQLGVEVSAIKQRFIALTPDGVTINAQAQLLEVLRAWAEAQREAAE